MKKNVSPETSRRPERATTPRQTRKAPARRYEKPRIETFSSKEILQEVGPAQGYSGSVGGVDSPF